MIKKLKQFQQTRKKAYEKFKLYSFINNVGLEVEEAGLWYVILDVNPNTTDQQLETLPTHFDNCKIVVRVVGDISTDG